MVVADNIVFVRQLLPWVVCERDDGLTQNGRLYVIPVDNGV